MAGRTVVAENNGKTGECPLQFYLLHGITSENNYPKNQALRPSNLGSKAALLGALVTPYYDFKPSVSVLFGYYSLPWWRILTKLRRTKFEKTT